ncbi:DUF1612 domain-containing protein [Methylobacterium nonmethylotrophicum]|uniref:DUF1612 domain-containing protein n=1 Tax=Methylobacterium nonmethylotrophicum TaxID=1141884 RepID=UPI001FE03907|nr:DUF1612 domain-containing protein [Methylobacterium nonmethylotrophicum]
MCLSSRIVPPQWFTIPTRSASRLPGAAWPVPWRAPPTRWCGSTSASPRSEPVLADGARARAHLFDAQAALSLEGAFVALEDLVLHEAAMDVRRATHALGRAAAMLADRRRLAAAPTGRASSAYGWALLAGPGPAASLPPETEANRPDPEDEEAPGPDLAAIDRLLARIRRALAGFASGGPAPHADPGEDPVCSWRRVLDETRDLPAVLAAAIALDAWLVLDPSPREGHRGSLAAAALLRARAKARAHLPALSLGPRDSRARWSRALPMPERLAGLLEAVEAAAAAGATSTA